MKMLSASKEAFLREVQIPTWKAAQEKIPQFANLELLEKFKVQKGKPLPKSFQVCLLFTNTIHCLLDFCLE